MNIIERYASAYIIECVSGIEGENPDYVHEVLRKANSNTKHPLLRQVIDFVNGKDLDTAEVKSGVEKIVRDFIGAGIVPPIAKRW